MRQPSADGAPAPATAAGDTVADLVAALTRAEKLRLVRGTADPDGRATGYVPPVERLGIPACRFTDGPAGVRAGRATSFPAPVCVAATWDPAVAERVGRAVAAEARAKEFDALLAPGVNLVRVPECGRNFEYFGEDPHLTARLAAGAVRGIRSMDVLATPKHLVANNQETDRLRVNAAVGERALRECYLRGFAAAVDAGEPSGARRGSSEQSSDGGAGAVMAAYNRVNGVHAAEHGRLLGDVLKGEWGFDGVAVSDWGGVADGAAAAAAGLDLEMPGATPRELLLSGGLPTSVADLRRRWPVWFPGGRVETVHAALAGLGDRLDPTVAPRSGFAASLPGALDRGAVSADRLDDMVARLLRQYRRVGLLDPAAERAGGALGTSAHRDLARTVAARGTVLLTNEGLLPLDAAELDAVAVLGPCADAAPVQRGGSAAVTPLRVRSPLAGLRDRWSGVRVTFEPGVPAVSPSVADRLAARLPGPGGPSLDAAVAAAADADVAVVTVRDVAGEGNDRDSLALPGAQERLVRAVAATDTPTAVVSYAGAPVELPWVDDVEAVLQAWYPGQEAGDALAAVLSGDVDPGGRLPVTVGRSARDYPARSDSQYPGVPTADGYPEARYEEGLLVGYRGFDAAGTEPRFPFGHGHSYATFAYDDLAVERWDGDAPGGEVSVAVENRGDRPGRDVVQAYVEPDGARLPRPPRELAGFAPVRLAPGEVRRVSVPLSPRALAAYDPGRGEWVTDADRLGVAVGRSSRDLPVRTTLGSDLG